MTAGCPTLDTSLALYLLYLTVQQAVVIAGDDGSFTFKLNAKQMHDRRYWDNRLDPRDDTLVGVCSLPPKRGDLRSCVGTIRFAKLNIGIENRLLVTNTDARENENRQGSEEFHFPAYEAHLGKEVGTVATMPSANQWPV